MTLNDFGTIFQLKFRSPANALFVAFLLFLFLTSVNSLYGFSSAAGSTILHKLQQQSHKLLDYYMTNRMAHGLKKRINFLSIFRLKRSAVATEGREGGLCPHFGLLRIFFFIITQRQDSWQ